MYTREELDNIECEYAFQLFGRAVLMDVESYKILMKCAEQEIPASKIIEALQPQSKERRALRKPTFPNILRLLL